MRQKKDDSFLFSLLILQNDRCQHLARRVRNAHGNPRYSHLLRSFLRLPAQCNRRPPASLKLSCPQISLPASRNPMPSLPHIPHIPPSVTPPISLTPPPFA